MESSEAGASGVKVMTRMQMYTLMQQHKGTIVEKLNFLKETLLNEETYTDNERSLIQTKLKSFKSHFRARWNKANRLERTFLNQNREWLNHTENIPKSCSKQGRPKKSFTELTERGKRRRTEDLRKSCEVEELRFATESKLREVNQADAAKIVHDITISPERAKKIRAAYYATTNQQTHQYNIEKVLAVYIDAELSRQQYETIRELDKKQFPSYKLLQNAKSDCYPQEEAFSITATSATVNLQELLNHTSRRLLIYLENVIATLSDEECARLELIVKWGCDGSQQHSYKQKFDNETDSDHYLLQSSLVPLQLLSGKTIIWQNPQPSSPRFCRPIRFQFIQETVNTIRQETTFIQDQINNLHSTTIEGTTVSVKYSMVLTMVDGKTCNAMTGTTSTMRCYICGLTSKDFNKLSEAIDSEPINPEAIKFGISTLHARIKFFENLLHISYRLPIKKWIIKSPEEKYILKTRKLFLQDEFKKQMGLLVDMPKQGYGNTNDGNTSRRFFDDPELSATITGLDKQLIFRFKVILEAMSSGFKIDLKKFEIYNMDTAKLYIDLYPWYPMSPTIHKVLIHSTIIIEHALLPIGQLSEDAIETQNKHFKLYRLHHARKCSREKCNRDVINRLLLKSDPLISSTRKKPSRRSKPFLKETLELLVPSTASEDEEDANDANNNH